MGGDRRRNTSSFLAGMAVLQRQECSSGVVTPQDLTLALNSLIEVLSQACRFYSAVPTTFPSQSEEKPSPSSGLQAP